MREIWLMPDLEEDELSVIYEARRARRTGTRNRARDDEGPDAALDAMVREELNITRRSLRRSRTASSPAWRPRLPSFPSFRS